MDEIAVRVREKTISALKRLTKEQREELETRYLDGVRETLGIIEREQPDQVVFLGRSASAMSRDLRQVAQTQRLELPPVNIIDDTEASRAYYESGTIEEKNAQCQRTFSGKGRTIMCDDYWWGGTKGVQLRRRLDEIGQRETTLVSIVSACEFGSQHNTHVLVNGDCNLANYVLWRNIYRHSEIER